MAMTEMDFIGGGGGGNEYGYLFTFTMDEMRSATDSTPIVIRGDFSTVGGVITYGQYYGYPSASGGYAARQLNLNQNITLGQTFQMPIAQYNWSSTQSYRNITIYSDRIEIGSGYYGSTEDSGYGYISVLSVPKVIN